MTPHPDRPDNHRISELSKLAVESGDPQYLSALHRIIWRPEYTLAERQYFYWQRLIRHASIAGIPALEPSVLYADLLADYKKAIGIPPRWIPPAERNADRVVVITNQLLDLAHAPTADCLNYAHTLQTRLGKQVAIVNTAAMPWQDLLPYYKGVRFNYVKEFAGIDRLKYRDAAFDFYQCREPMPNVEEGRAIVRTVLDWKPSFVFSLGHSNPAPDLLADFLTVVAMPFGTTVPRAICNVYVLPRTPGPEEEAFMNEWRIRPEQVVTTEYTFRLPDRTATLTRSDLGLPADACVIAVVGNRLDDEVTGFVVAELGTILGEIPNTFIAFMGTFPSYARVAAEHPLLQSRSAFLGHQRDILAAYECCDAYYNPPRYGGGTSSAYALAMGLPVMTRPDGDVAPSVGPQFHFTSTAAIVEFVRRLAGDPGERRRWSEMARARFAQISDREGMLRDIVAAAERLGDLRVSELA